MNWQKIARSLGLVLCAEAGLLLLPAIVALIHRESPLPFIIAAMVAAALGIPGLLVRSNDRPIYAGEGFFVVSVSWLLISLIGAIPFVVNGAIPSYIDAFFETVSGFTTTGASILTDIEALSRSLLFWRSLTHWIGGMGVLVFIIAVVPQTNSNTMHLMRAEIPGPTVDKLVPRARQTAIYLYAIYLFLTAAETAALLLCRMPLYDSLVNSFATAGTGGFSVLNAGIAGYGNPAAEWVIAVFMLLFGINFSLYFLLLMRDFKQVFRNEEAGVYLAVIALATAAITVNTLSRATEFGQTIRGSFFQVCSIITTTGFATVDFNGWPTLSKALLALLMVLGACGGSTGGAMKVSRVIIVMKKFACDITRMLHPRAVVTLRLNGKKVDDSSVNSACVFFAAYFLLAAAGFVLVSLDGFDLETTLSSVFACIGNIGPGFGSVGPMGNYSAFSVLSKLVLSFEMLLGRLELYPLIIIFIPALYRRR